MHRKYFLGILIVTLLSFFLILMNFMGSGPTETRTENIPTVKVPYPQHISGVGIVEPASGNILIGTPFNRIVKKVNVAVNDKVKKGDVLIELDNGDLVATLKVKQIEYKKAATNFQMLKELPRHEDLAIAEESLKKAQAVLAASKKQYDMVLNLPSPNAVSKEQQNIRLSNFQQAEADLNEKQAQYKKIKSGTWQPDLKIAFQQVEQAKAEIYAIQNEIQRTSITAPADGTVLQIKIHEGEISGPDPSKALMIFGNVDHLNLRVSINQFDATYINPDHHAVAFRQSDLKTEYPLTYLYAEPLMIPKKYLTNATNEKIDTQVFEVLYRIENNQLLILGEQMDVFIEKK